MLNPAELIAEVKERPLLWDRNYTAGSDASTSARDDLWQEIAVKLGISKDQARTKWKMLRDTYRKVLYKKIHIRRYRYVKEMEFLKETLLGHKGRPRLTVRIKKEVPDDSIDVSETVVADPLSYIDNSNFSEEARGNSESNNLSLENDSLIFGGSVSTKQRNDKVVWMAAQDHDLQFLLSLHQHFKEVPSHRKLPLRMKIEEIILEEIYNTKEGENEEQT